ncbi:hypothetical protein [Streptomyces sp. NBC_00059]|uniref:hypothetical protein n=1 Tax=Streptomyces sp. NBC_00059 TaxID=2975635 RepID=UPI0022555D1E|nr:hypothetical protein [Streptomyces sp. NBC_00059]MCX5410752.1 hypothetical protein [Streptomyces sp. NBC_00059]
MTDEESGGPEREIIAQHNHGSGAFVGRDNHGEIHVEMLDAQTKAYLREMSKEAPGLARLLRKAVRDGAISPDTADALALAARSINEDVANALRDASRSINPDVAHLLSDAGRNINEDVARRVSQAAEDLTAASRQLAPEDFAKAITRFEEGLATLDRLTKTFNGIQDLPREIERLQNPDRPFGRLEQIGTVLSSAADRIEATVTPPPPRLIVDRKAQLSAFGWGLAIGAVFIFYFSHR